MFGLVPVQFGGKFLKCTSCSGSSAAAVASQHLARPFFEGFHVFLLIYFDIFRVDRASSLLQFLNFSEIDYKPS